MTTFVGIKKEELKIMKGKESLKKNAELMYGFLMETCKPLI